ncbi:hypothetical protein F2P56_012271, partial [Juglans regia]
GSDHMASSARSDQARIHLPSDPGDKPLDDEALLKLVPIHIVTQASQLPTAFLEPSPESQLVIGFDCEGVDLCRHGTLCIMQLALPDAIYLVDAIQGGEMLMRACKPALESAYITKVVHDCKRDSEALYFQFGIKLNNVVDTQIAYSLIEEQEGRTRSPDDYISFVGVLADPRYCGIIYVVAYLILRRKKFASSFGRTLSFGPTGHYQNRWSAQLQMMSAFFSTSIIR